MSSDGAGGSEEIALGLPASAEWLALARTTGAAIASRWHFTYDEIADLRLAIDELCLTLIEPGPVHRLELIYSLDPTSIEVRGHITLDGSAPSEMAAPSSTELSERILDALVDAHGSKRDASTRTGWLRKERSVP